MDAELRSGLEELEKKNITSLLLQNGAGERHGFEELEKRSQVVCFEMDQVRGVGWRSWRRRTSPVFFKMEQVRGMGWRS